MRHQPLKMLGLAALVALFGLLGFALAGCGSEEGISAGGTRQETSRTAPSQQASMPPCDRRPWPTEGSSPARLSGDGRYFGFVRAASADPLTISFDVAQFFYGKSVQKAAEEDGATPPGEPVANDHYERDAETRAQTLTVAKDAQVMAAIATRLTVSPKAKARSRSGCPDGFPVSLDEFFASFERKPNRMSAAGGPFWVTIRDGVVTRIDEQYFP